jgi:hypothetical protein
MSYEDLRLKVKCPCCILEYGDVDEETLILIGDDKQSMQCMHCGYASSSEYKDKLADDVDDRFKEVCKNISGRNWLPGVFTSDNYYITPDVKDGKLIWYILTKLETEATKVEMPHYSDAFNIVKTMERNHVNEV